jgi:hypothetical protein
MSDSPAQEVARAIARCITLYPEHIAIVNHVARIERRAFSNAVQMIIERYATEHTLATGQDGQQRHSKARHGNL